MFKTNLTTAFMLPLLNLNLEDLNFKEAFLTMENDEIVPKLTLVLDTDYRRLDKLRSALKGFEHTLDTGNNSNPLRTAVVTLPKNVRTVFNHILDGKYSKVATWAESTFTPGSLQRLICTKDERLIDYLAEEYNVKPEILRESELWKKFNLTEEIYQTKIHNYEFNNSTQEGLHSPLLGSPTGNEPIDNAKISSLPDEGESEIDFEDYLT